MEILILIGVRSLWLLAVMSSMISILLSFSL